MVTLSPFWRRFVCGIEEKIVRVIKIDLCRQRRTSGQFPSIACQRVESEFRCVYQIVSGVIREQWIPAHIEAGKTDEIDQFRVKVRQPQSEIPVVGGTHQQFRLESADFRVGSIGEHRSR